MSSNPANNGETGEKIQYSTATFMAIAAFTAIAWYNAIELNLQVFLTFKRHRGLYFWSLLISSWGCVLHSLGFILKFFQLTTNDYLSVTIITIGWYAMVTGQAVVLYSRLHLVVREQRTLRLVLSMIIVDAICFHIPTTILTYGSNSSDPNKYAGPFSYMERIQMTAFCIQEFIISGIYVYATIKLLRPVYHGRTRKVMMQLIWINLIIITMDVILLAMEYKGNYEIEATLKAMVYSIKLKLEFAVLNQLMQLANSGVADATLAMNREARAEDPRAGSIANQRSPSITTAGTPHVRQYNGFGGHSASATSKFPGPQWLPSLDRHCIVKTEHIEVCSEDKQGAGIDLAMADPGGLLSRDLNSNSPVARLQAPIVPANSVIRSQRPSVTAYNADYKRARADRAQHSPTLGRQPSVIRSNRNSVSEFQNDYHRSYSEPPRSPRTPTYTRHSANRSNRPSNSDLRISTDLPPPLPSQRESVIRSNRPSVSEFQSDSPTESEIQLDPLGKADDGRDY
ncbi:MAG: hypothetical protein M1827_001825 [Pycnora praestabilis]|nr:MAG: hypothetical protein M1827_001825 [Pycnora praestabilis]